MTDDKGKKHTKIKNVTKSVLDASNYQGLPKSFYGRIQDRSTRKVLQVEL